MKEAKVHLRVTSRSEDTYIRSLISVATLTIESMLQRTLLPATFQAFYDTYSQAGQDYYRSGLVFEIPRLPVNSVTELAVQDDNLVYQVTPATDYIIETYEHTAELVMLTDSLLTNLNYEARRNPSTRITFTAGYAPSADIPAPITQAILMLIKHLFDNREPVTIGTISSSLPLSIDALLQPYKYRRVSV